MTIETIHISAAIFVILSGLLLIYLVYKRWKILDESYQRRLDLLRKMENKK